MSTPACEDVATISARIQEIEMEKRPRCPVGGRPLFIYDCLRHAEPCPERCALRGDWIGPEK